ncbi:hypothetical protein VTK73DRAFT_588 [Phialemonium thermophilum]|uniref:Epoxide hydrolase N-terminal domain-containing protein n=1 Tax=Phialemonium thermophilum TaxID=223376 RepID=A0ABR3VUQ7_9PEZI
MSKSSYASVPSGAPGRPEPFTLHVPEPELDDFRQLLRLSKIAPETWENSERHGDANLGLTREWLVQARDAWLDDFDWRAHEAYINSFPNFRIRVPDHAAPAGQQQQQEEEEEGHLDLHFAALFSTRPDAIPVVFMHGWPGSFLEFLPMLDLLRVKYAADQLPFHAVVPSLPGYTLSGGPPRTRDFTLSDAARAMHQLMVELGFGGGYVAQGGDVGYFLARIMSATYDGCKALHVNFLFPAPNEMPQGVEGLTESEKEHLERTQKWRSTGMAYAMEHATRPATIGLVLSSSPLALLAW